MESGGPPAVRARSAPPYRARPTPARRGRTGRHRARFDWSPRSPSHGRGPWQPPVDIARTSQPLGQAPHSREASAVLERNKVVGTDKVGNTAWIVGTRCAPERHRADGALGQMA